MCLLGLVVSCSSCNYSCCNRSSSSCNRSRFVVLVVVVAIKIGVKVVGVSYLASKVSSHASFALSNNIINWITDFYNEETTQINFDFEDEVIQSSVLAYEGKIMNERFA